jgi:uncharacterized protein involved in exopolysaccharide biosynthesis
MSLNAELRTPPERRNAMAERRAEAMNRHVELEAGQGQCSPYSKEVTRSVELEAEQGSSSRYSNEFDRPVYPLQVQRNHSEHTDWRRAIDILRKHWRLSTLFALAVAVTVTVATLMMKPVYEPQARVEVDPPGAEVFSLQGNNNSGTSADYIETQAQNLQNDELTLEVIRKLHLDQSPYFGADPYAISTGSRLATEVAVPLTPAENRALFVFRQSRKVTRDVASRLITVSVSAHNPMVAAAVTNTLVNMFIERDYQLRNEAISQSSKWLQRQLDDIRQRMDEANHALSTFEKDNGISTIGDNHNIFTEEIFQLSRQLIQA